MIYFLLFFTAFLSGCGKAEKKVLKRNLKGDFLFRKSNETFFIPPPHVARVRENYPWEDKYVQGMARITKDFFRCKGNALNPVLIKNQAERPPTYYRDCSAHGLPLRDGKEFIYPCLIDLLNYVQEKTGKKVVITCGHRCPKHNLYADTSAYNWGSKHMIGAEVDFYVEGMENELEQIVHILQQFYQEKYPKDKEYKTFNRFEKEGLNIRTAPWFNKEVFIKAYQADEGRDFDNSHRYPYIGIQVRYDKDLKRKVVFDQSLSENYLRH